MSSFVSRIDDMSLLLVLILETLPCRPIKRLDRDLRAIGGAGFTFTGKVFEWTIGAASWVLGRSVVKGGGLEVKAPLETPSGQIEMIFPGSSL